VKFEEKEIAHLREYQGRNVSRAAIRDDGV
jgi:hypothetical protein